jgi:hypothetical protein
LSDVACNGDGEEDTKGTFLRSLCIGVSRYFGENLPCSLDGREQRLVHAGGKGSIILRLQKNYGAERVDAACARALALGTRSYSSLATILKNRQDGKTHPEAGQLGMFHENIRGPGYYH